MAAPLYRQTLYIDTASNLPTVSDDGQIAYILDSQSSVTYSTATSSWNPVGRQMVFKSSVSVNAKTLASTLIYTLPASPLYFYPTQIVPRNVNISGVTTGPSVSIGTNATSYDNIASTQLISTLLSTVAVSNGVPQNTSYSPALSGGTAIYAKVTTAAIATNYTLKYDILGFYDSTTP